MKKKTELPILVMIHGVSQGERWKLDPAGTITIGRSPESTITIACPTVSRAHCKIVLDGGSWYLSDLDSYNGTFLNAKEVAAQEVLKAGDVIGISDNLLLFTDAMEPNLPGSDRGVTGDETVGLLQEREVALFLTDMVRSSEFAIEKGDTVFTDFVGEMRNIIVGLKSANPPLFLKCTGDGFLALYEHVSQAFGAACTLLEQAPAFGMTLRIVIHRGAVKTGWEGEPLGIEVHRIFRIEGVEEADRAEKPPGADVPLPHSQRILVTKAALEEMPDDVRERFRSAGKFSLKAFQEPCELWLYEPGNQASAG